MEIRSHVWQLDQGIWFEKWWWHKFGWVGLTAGSVLHDVPTTWETYFTQATTPALSDFRWQQCQNKTQLQSTLYLICELPCDNLKKSHCINLLIVCDKHLRLKLSDQACAYWLMLFANRCCKWANWCDVWGEEEDGPMWGLILGKTCRVQTEKK